ncbi:hypothetical protein SPRG_11991 [Saprolegnia parasitica CBS 223.65]|uniref:MICOS complex subunit n=1 Tax=Saprolegnia parasitica (strain CBS 223.65) TaxID=695850 RepID=A0A067BWF3_SAPPC|nr:hypothetical protein SPRG_11991 [Saprolegnia parasitica CBS 223.65]KDO22854.1 hypothetical protein SPRG_11991 [Saprolegnia parasitica CBS 223.65]|eukprot:XP_012206411.1 hypothetical protein SPRG_11991 [Saprolegnia parasitica CBS 223.65]
MSVDVPATPAAPATPVAEPVVAALAVDVPTPVSPIDSAKAQIFAAKDQAIGQVSAWKVDVTTAVAGQVDVAKELTGATRLQIKRVGTMVWTTVKQPVAEAIQVLIDANSSKGTPLRSIISDARASVNTTLYNVQVSTKESQEAVVQSLVPVQESLVVAQEHAIKFNVFRKAYPAVVVGGAAAIIGLPTLLRRGKVYGGVYAVAAAGLTGGAMYAADEVEKCLRR